MSTYRGAAVGILLGLFFLRMEDVCGDGIELQCLQRGRKRRAAVTRISTKTESGQRIFASGLRNSVGLAVNPKTNTIWAADNGRDWLGDDLPPEEVNDLGAGGNFGWPYCYGDRVPDRSQSKDYDCSKTVAPKVTMQAHSAPLGLLFYDGNMFPAEYRGSMFVTFHGSWNRRIPTGYRVVRIPYE